jgi:hypothetical protein
MVTYNEKHSYIRGSLEIGNSEERLFCYQNIILIQFKIYMENILNCIISDNKKESATTTRYALL